MFIEQNIPVIPQHICPSSGSHPPSPQQHLLIFTLASNINALLYICCFKKTSADVAINLQYVFCDFCTYTTV